MQEQETIDFFKKCHQLIKDPLTNPCLKRKAVSEILIFLSNSPILMALPFFLDSGLIPDLFKLKGYEQDHQILEILFLLIQQASKEPLKHLLEKTDIINFLCSYTPHHKPKILSKVAVILSRFSGVSFKVSEALLNSGFFEIIYNGLYKQNDQRIMTSLSYFLYKTSLFVSEGNIVHFKLCLTYVHYLLLNAEGVVLANAYEILINVIQVRNADSVKAIGGFEKALVLSLERWNKLDIISKDGVGGDEESLLNSFLKAFALFVKFYDEEFLKFAIRRVPFENFLMLLQNGSSRLCKNTMRLLEEIFNKSLSENILENFLHMKTLLRWLETVFEADRKEKFCFALSLLHNIIKRNPLKFGLRINQHSKCLKILSGVYESMISKTNRLVILEIFSSFLYEMSRYKGDFKKDLQKYWDNVSEFVLLLKKSLKVMREDCEEIEYHEKINESLRDLEKRAEENVQMEMEKLKI